MGGGDVVEAMLPELEETLSEALDAASHAIDAAERNPGRSSDNATTKVIALRAMAAHLTREATALQNDARQGQITTREGALADEQEGIEARDPDAETDKSTSAAGADWHIADWLASMHSITAAVGSALNMGRADGQMELEFVRSLAEGIADGNRPAAVAHVRALLQEGCVLDLITSAVVEGVEKLAAARAASGNELQAKFVEDGAGMLSYGGLNTFYGGLEGKIGAPNPRVMVAMAAEHEEAADSHEKVTTSNYELTTTSAIEWAFVATPDCEPRTGWPAEERLRRAHAQSASSVGRSAGDEALIASGARMRAPMPLDELRALIAERNEQLAALSEPPLELVEAYGARLYTGPLCVSKLRIRAPRSTRLPSRTSCGAHSLSHV